MAPKQSDMQVRLTEYLLPFRKPFATARQSHSSSRGIIVEVAAEGHRGFGEANPRRFVTGERFEDVVDAAPIALEEVVSNRTTLLSPTSRDLRPFVRHLRQVLSKADSAANGFPSLTLAIEMALLDLQSQRDGLPLFRTLAPREERCFSSNAFTSNLLGKGPEEVVRRANAAGDHGYLRTKLTGSWEIDEPICTALFRTLAERGAATSVWFDLNESLDDDWRPYLSKQLDAARSVGFINEVVLEQPTPRVDVAQLQAISEYLKAEEPGTWSVMADESVVDMDDLERICALNADLTVPIQVNIKPQKVGSLLDAVDMADRLREVDDRARVYFGGIIGSTDLSGWATLHLNHAAHNTGFSTAHPKRNFRRQLCTTPLVNPRDPCPGQDLVGLGTTVDKRALERVTARVTVPQPTRSTTARVRGAAGRVRRRATAAVRRRVRQPQQDVGSEHAGRLVAGRAQNVYDTPLPSVDKKAFDSYLLQGANLRAGLPSRRTRQLRFATSMGGQVITFHWTAATYRGVAASPPDDDCFPGLPDTRFPRVEVLRDKELFRQQLRECGLPYVPGFAVDMHDSQVAVARASSELGYPVVLKPAIGTGGVGVTTGIRSRRELERAWEGLLRNERAMARNAGYFIVERHISGVDARAYVVGDELVGSYATQPATLVGDGRSTARELLAHGNELRRANPHLRDRPLRMNGFVRDLLAAQGYVPNDVLPKGHRVQIARNGNPSQGGETISLLGTIDPGLELRLASFLSLLDIDGLRQSGIDFILTETNDASLGDAFFVNEANSTPAIGSHQFPMYGSPTDVGAETLRAHAMALGHPLGNIDGFDEPIYVDIHTHTPEDTRWLQLALQNDGCRVERAATREDDADVVTSVRGTGFEIAALYSALPDPRDRSGAAVTGENSTRDGIDPPPDMGKPIGTWTFIPH